MSRIPEWASLAEELGIDQLGVPDHVALGPDSSAYPYGAYPGTPTSPYPEPLTLLAAVAARTRRIELSPSTLIVPLRPAVLLAKACATLDALSNGRFILGAGTGWHESEFIAAGVPFAGRGKRMDDTLRACRILWRDSPATFSSETVSFEDLCCEPRPAEPDRIRIHVGGSDPQRAARRIAMYADGWLPPPSLTVEELADGIQRIREQVATAEHPRDDLEFKFALPARGQHIGRALDAAMPELIPTGVTVVQVSVSAFVSSAAEVPAFLELLAEQFAPYRS